jgi:hypothetical protein
MITSSQHLILPSFFEISFLRFKPREISNIWSTFNGDSSTFGTIPVFLNAEILSATTISGTTVIGLTPVFFWNMKVPKISFT